MISRSAVIIPVLNEEESIGRVISALPRDLAQIIVVDNGSTDRSADEALGAGATDIVREVRRGYGRAMLSGIDALDEDIEYVGFIDGDGSDNPSQLIELIELVSSNQCDLAIGSRTLGNCEDGALTPQQRFGNWLSTRLIKLLWKHDYSDLGPMRAVRLAELRRIKMVDKDFGWTVEMQAKALVHGLRVMEVAVDYKNRYAGKSKISGTIKGSVFAGYKIITTIFRIYFREGRLIVSEGGVSITNR